MSQQSHAFRWNTGTPVIDELGLEGAPEDNAHILIDRHQGLLPFDSTQERQYLILAREFFSIAWRYSPPLACSAG